MSRSRESHRTPLPYPPNPSSALHGPGSDAEINQAFSNLELDQAGYIALLQYCDYRSVKTLSAITGQ